MEDVNETTETETNNQDSMTMEEFLEEHYKEEALLAGCPYTYPELY